MDRPQKEGVVLFIAITTCWRKSDGLLPGLRDLFVLKEHRSTKHNHHPQLLSVVPGEVLTSFVRAAQNMGLDLREDASGAFVAGLSEVDVRLSRTLACGWRPDWQQNKEKNFLNMNSSRSHAILSVRVRRAQGRSTLVGFCDLAGSERLSRGGTKKHHGRERQHQPEYLESCYCYDQAQHASARRTRDLFLSGQQTHTWPTL